MGIRGLSTFFNNNPDLSKPYKLHDTSVIIDGNNLVHLLYFSNKVDCIYGGDYNKYATTIKRYFNSYIECNVKPIILFDGGYDKSDRKFRTVLLRSRTRLTVTQHIAKYRECGGNVLPINAQEVFRNVLTEINIPFAQCDYEADNQIAALANYYNCPVISDDSDFYIFDIHKGFIRLSSIETAVVETDLNGMQLKFLKCYLYHIDTFLSYFTGIDKCVLPLFGTLVGNDFVNTNDFEKFFSNIRLPKTKRKGLKINHRQKKIIGLLSWLNNYDLDEGIKQVLMHLKKEKRDHVKYSIDKSIEGYKEQRCNLAFVIDNKLEDLENALRVDTKLAAPCGQFLPIPFAIAFHQGNLASFCLNVINLHRIFLPAQVENVYLESSYVCSRYIRQIIYGILLQHPSNHAESHKDQCLRPIEEYDRRSGSIQRENVMPIFTLKNGNALPCLHDLYAMKMDDLQDTMTAVLDTDHLFFDSIPDTLQLLFISISYWMKNCSPKPTEEFIFAVVLNIIYFNILLNKVVTDQKEHKTSCNNQNIDISTIPSMIKTISEKQTQIAIQNMNKYLQKPSLNKGNPLILHIVHSYSQLQTCILYSNRLNAILGFPFQQSKLHDTFAGTMLYNLTKDILSRSFPDLFIAELLGRGTVLETLFSSLKNKILENVNTTCYIQIDRSPDAKAQSSKSNSRLKKLQNVPKKDISMPCNKFQCLNLLEETCDDDIDVFI